MDCINDQPFYSIQEQRQHPHASPQAYRRFACTGLFSILRTSSPRIEPGDMPLLMEAMSNRLIFLSPRRPACVAENRLFGQTPIRRVIVSGSTALRTYPDCQRCALASAPLQCGGRLARVPSARVLATLVRASAPRSARDCLRQTLASLPRWQSASFGADTCGRRFLLDLSVGLGSGSAWRRFIFISSPRAFSWLTHR